MLKPIKIESSIKEIKKIYHVSDIHIRNFKRHDEYRRVFDKLAEYINSTKTEESIICVTGDIVHSKTDITPELVQETQNFLKLMSSILPTIVIPGNHDANLNNNHRMDSLTPIINAMNDSNITYIKDTGIFKMANIDFVHWSVFDDPKKYIKASKIKSDYKICMFHGPVNNSLTEGDFSLTGYHMSVADFDGFDLVLLGDIHKRQFLNEAKTIAYPGSLVQQNHGEGLDHGILVWDIESKSSEYVPIENDTAFYTLYAENGIHLDIPEHLPKNLYLRLKSKNTPPTLIKEIVASVKKDRNVIELSHQTINNFSHHTSHQSTNAINVRDVTYQNILLSQYLKTKFSLPDDDIIKICELNKTINHKIPRLEVTRNIQWNPKRLEFSNMFSYGPDNVIDFTNMEGVYGIFAQNASGKSSSIEALVYCLFDKCSKTSKAGLVMNNKSREFHCKFEFELDGKSYVIERKASYRAKSESVKQDVNFYYIDFEGAQVSLNGDDRFGTNAKIREIIGSYEDFILTSMSMQNNNTGFIDMGQSDRKDLLSQFLDIKVFEDLYIAANEEIKEFSVLIKEYKKVDHFVKLKEFEEYIKTYSNQYRQLEKDKKDLEKSIEKESVKYMKLSSKVTQIDSKILDIDSLELKKESLISQKTKIKEDIKLNKDNLDITKIELTTIENEAQKIDLTSFNTMKSELQKDIDTEKTLSIQVEKLKTQLTHKLEKMKKLEDLKYDENCKFCMDNVFVKDAIATRDSIELDKIEAKSVVDNLRVLRENIQILKSYVSAQENLQNSLSKKKNDIIKLESNIDRLTLELHQRHISIKDVEDIIKQYKKKEAAIKSNQEISDQLKIIQISIDSLKSQLKDTGDDLMKCNTNIQLTQMEIETAKQSIENLKAVEEKYKYYEYYLSATGRDGLPYDIISSVIPRIQEDINNVLSQVVDFKISIESDGKNINAFIEYDDDRKWPIELSSGMEKFVSTLAIRSSLINITSLPRPNFLAIDEGFGALDQSNMGNISILLDYLKTQFKFIIMISHIDAIRDIVDAHIEITKGKDGFSKVQHK
jgi:DNA repair exonuclease SbcCD ATPase subunit